MTNFNIQLLWANSHFPPYSGHSLLHGHFYLTSCHIYAKLILEIKLPLTAIGTMVLLFYSRLRTRNKTVFIVINCRH